MTKTFGTWVGKKMIGAGRRMMVGGRTKKDDNWQKNKWEGNEDWKADDEWSKKGDDNWKENVANKPILVVMHLDELAMPERPVLEPAAQDCEVWVDPLPNDDELQEWLATFGQVEEVFRVPDQDSGKPGDRGYVLFKEHDTAKKCVDTGAGTWSESERTLSSQQARHGGGRSSTYPESIVGKILGSRGEAIIAVKDEIGATMLSLRGDGLFEHRQMGSKRVHFVCKGSPESIGKLQLALEKAMAKIHKEIKDKAADPEYLKRRVVRSRSPRRRDYQDRGREHREEAPWRPPMGESGPPPPPWAWPPPGQGPFPWPPPGPDGYPFHPGPWGPPPWGPPGPEGGPWGPPPPWGVPGPPPGDPMRPQPALDGPPPGHFGPPEPPGELPGTEKVAAGRGGSRRRKRRREEEESDGGKRGRGRRKSRHEGDAEGDAGAEGASRKRRKHRDKDGTGACEHAPEGDQHDPQAPASSTRPQESESNTGSAGPNVELTPAWSAVGYLEKLPKELTEHEKRLAAAVAAFMFNWRETHEEGSRPNLVHLGANAHIRDCKANALPREVSLKVWLKHRLGDKVDVIGQSVVLLDRTEQKPP